ncbi:MrcB family domain-containing protein [Roseomonas sp. GCM10028921]
MLREALARIAFEFRGIRRERFSGHPFGEFVRKSAAAEVRDALGDQGDSLVVKGSVGQGHFAEVPWIAVLDPTVTTSATRGYYVVYLFSADGARIVLSLNQGTTAAQNEYGARYLAALRERAGVMRFRLADQLEGVSSDPIDLAASGDLGKGYEAGHALGIEYDPGSLPSEGELWADLQRVVGYYLALTFRGGLDPALEPDAVSEEFGLPAVGGDGKVVPSLQEVRRYRLHMRIERNAKAARLAKQHHGLACQACGFDFEAVYGPLGVGYAEAHHRKPLASLEPGKAVRYDVATDFAVLCANCHRMAHRLPDPSDIEKLRTLITECRVLGTVHTRRRA